MKKALSKANVILNEMDLIKAKEAFVAQAIAVDRELVSNHDKLNVNGGAIATWSLNSSRRDTHFSHIIT